MCRALAVDLLTPVAKTFPAEKGFEANALAVQVHGGYGYTMEYDRERYFRESRLGVTGAGTCDVQKNIIAKTMGI